MNYQNEYDNLIAFAKSQNRKKLKRTHKEYIYYEKHHIIPRCIKEDNSPDNLILLTAQEHYKAHKLLHLIYPDNNSLFRAWNMMGGRFSEFMTEDEIAYKREEWAKRFSGEGNPNYNKKRSEEAKRKTSEGLLKFYSENDVWNKGKQLSESHKAGFQKAIEEGRWGGRYTPTEEHKRNHSEWMKKNSPIKGTNRSEETKDKIANSARGQWSAGRWITYNGEKKKLNIWMREFNLNKKQMTVYFKLMNVS